MIPVDRQHGESGQDRHQLFFQLYTRNQSQIFTYILSLVPNLSDSEDIFQDVSTALWEHFDDYQPGTHFAAWARKIAYHRVIDHYRLCGRSRVHYSTETLELIDGHLKRPHDQQDQRKHALKDCLSRLSSQDQALLRARYSEKTTVKTLAGQVGRSVQGLYKSFARIHHTLYECIRRKVTAEVMA